MVAVIIFWSALLAGVFFLLSTVMKGILSAFTGGVTTLANTFVVLFFGGGAALVLYLLYAIVLGIMKGTFWSVVGYIILFIIIIGIIGAILGSIGAALLVIALAITEFILGILIIVFTWFYNLFEKAYVHFLRVIVDKIEKC